MTFWVYFVMLIGYILMESLKSEKFDMLETTIDCVDVTSPHWLAIQKSFAFLLLTTIHRF